MATFEEINRISQSVVGKVTLARLKSEPGSLWLQTDNEASVLANLKTIERQAKEWAARGTDAVLRGTVPGAGGWDGWIKAGQILMDGATEQLKEKSVILPAIIETVKEAPKHINKDLQEAGKVAGSAAGSLVGGVLSGAWPLVMVALVGAGAYLYMRLK